MIDKVVSLYDMKVHFSSCLWLSTHTPSCIHTRTKKNLFRLPAGHSISSHYSFVVVDKLCIQHKQDTNHKKYVLPNGCRAIERNRRAYNDLCFIGSHNHMNYTSNKLSYLMRNQIAVLKQEHNT